MILFIKEKIIKDLKTCHTKIYIMMKKIAMLTNNVMLIQVINYNMIQKTSLKLITIT